MIGIVLEVGEYSRNKVVKKLLFRGNFIVMEEIVNIIRYINKVYSMLRIGIKKKRKVGYIGVSYIGL